MSNLDKDRELANKVYAQSPEYQALPEQWIHAEKVREEADRMDKGAENLKPWYNDFSRGYAEAMKECAEHLRNLLTPYLPTLAELIEAGNDPKQYQWMQCKEAHFPTGGTGAQGIILSSDEISSLILERNGAVVTWRNSLVTPLQGEPKLEWTGSGDTTTISNDEKVTADQQPNTSETPKSSIKPEDVPPNEPWLIEADGQKAIGTRYKGDAYAPWAVAALNGLFAEDYPDYEITLIHKLVPDPPALPDEKDETHGGKCR